MMNTIDRAVEIDLEIAETDMLRGIVPQIVDGEEVGRGNIETGETTLMIGHQGAARTLLILGPVVEEITPQENHLADPKSSNPPM